MCYYSFESSDLLSQHFLLAHDNNFNDMSNSKNDDSSISASAVTANTSQNSNMIDSVKYFFLL